MKYIFAVVAFAASMVASPVSASPNLPDSNIRLFPYVYSLRVESGAHCQLRLMNQRKSMLALEYAAMLSCQSKMKDIGGGMMAADLVSYVLKGEQSFSPNLGHVDDPNVLELYSDEENRQAKVVFSFGKDSVEGKIETQLDWLNGQLGSIKESEPKILPIPGAPVLVPPPGTGTYHGTSSTTKQGPNSPARL